MASFHRRRAFDLEEPRMATLRHLNLPRTALFFLLSLHCHQIKPTCRVQWSACRSECSLFLTMSASWTEKQWLPHVTVLNRCTVSVLESSFSYVWTLLHYITFDCGSVKGDHKVLWIMSAKRYSQTWRAKWSREPEMHSKKQITHWVIFFKISFPT